MCKQTTSCYPPVLLSLILAPSIIAICGLAQGFRQIVERYIESDSTKLLFMEAIAAFELCANASELALVNDNFDMLSYTLFLFATHIWYSYNWDKASACPYFPLEDVVEGNIEYQEAIFKICAQIAGGIIGLYCINFIYCLGLLKIHRGRSWAGCCSFIEIPLLAAILIEAAFTCTYRILTKVIDNSEMKNSEIVSCVASLMLFLVGRELTVSALNYPGCNLNPLLSSVSKFTCDGTSTFQHICVFWVGPCLGSIASLYVYPLIKDKF